MENGIFVDLVFKVIVSTAALIIIAQFGRFQLPYEIYFLWRWLALSEPKISEGLCHTDSFNEMFRVSKLIYSINGVYKLLSLTNPKSTAIGFCNHLDLDARVAKKDLFKSIKRTLVFRINSEQNIILEKLLVSLDNKFPGVLSAKHIYLIQSMILCRLGIRLTDEVLRECFDLAIDENEKLFERMEYQWTRIQVAKIHALLDKFKLDNNQSRKLLLLLEREVEKTNEQIPLYLRLKSTFVNEVRSDYE